MTTTKTTNNHILLYDLETTAIGPNGELPDHVHICAIHNVTTDERFEFLHNEMHKAIEMLEDAMVTVAHFLLGFDSLVLRNVYGYVPRGLELDSMVLCYMLEGDIKERVDYERYEQDQLTKKATDPLNFGGGLIGSQSLEAWGMRLGYPKDQYSSRMKKRGLDPWAKYNAEMGKYCHVDVDILVRLWEEILSERVLGGNYNQAITLEHKMAVLMHDLKRDGTHFNIEKANKLVKELRDYLPTIERDLAQSFPPTYEPDKWVSTEYKGKQAPGQKMHIAWEQNYAISCMPYERYYKKLPDVLGAVFIPKKTMGGRVKGAGYCKLVLKPLNPNSRPQLTRRLKALGWVPDKFTEAGNPQLNSEVMDEVAKILPETKDLARYYLLKKRLSQIADGKEAWLKKVVAGKIHPTINPCATVTHRATHSNPNMSQVPAVQFKAGPDGKPVVAMGEEGGWGYECRELFEAPSGWAQVGVDLSALELRCLAHYLEEFDGGDFGYRLVNEDVHEYNRTALDIPNRGDAKSFFFALLYSAGNLKLGGMIYPELTDQMKMAKGKVLRHRLMSGIVGLAKINKKYGLQADRQGELEIIDGRMIPVRSSYAALNTLLQSTGSVLAKYWIVEAIRTIEEDLGLKKGYDQDYVLTGYFHDEIQIVCKPEYAESIKEVVMAASLRAGKAMKFSLPLESEGKTGINWAECH